jgi:hypothetical protein
LLDRALRPIAVRLLGADHCASVLAADEDEARADHLNAVIDSQLSSPAALEAMRASLERLLPRD